MDAYGFGKGYLRPSSLLHQFFCSVFDIHMEILAHSLFNGQENLQIKKLLLLARMLMV